MTVETIEELKAALHTDVVEVVFEKVDKSLRTMRCTLLDEYITSISHSSPSTRPTELVTVWDIEKEAWRSFKANNVITWKRILE